jgi:hypothetical protein
MHPDNHEHANDWGDDPQAWGGEAEAWGGEVQPWGTDAGSEG